MTVQSPSRPVRRILFWGLLRGERPQDFVRTDISAERREALAVVLSAGRTVEVYFGHANCRICHAPLGCRDVGQHGFVWPERAAHYILAHQVWTPDCELLELVARKR